jgi:hypothetical protein
MKDTAILVFKKKDAGILEKAIELFQKERGINRYQIRWGINGLRMYFEDVKKEHRRTQRKANKH